MIIKPNNTKLTLQVTQIAISPDGFGSQGLGTVICASNARSSLDFIKATEGDEIAFFIPESNLVVPGGRYDVEATLIADERGGQIVLRRVRPNKG